MILILGVAGACKSKELTKVTLKDIEPRVSVYIFNVPETKMCIPRSFMIPEKFVKIMKEYAALRPTNVQIKRLFIIYTNETCSAQVIEIHEFAETLRKIAKYLHLENPELYTGHSF